MTTTQLRSIARAVLEHCAPAFRALPGAEIRGLRVCDLSGAVLDFDPESTLAALESCGVRRDEAPQIFQRRFYAVLRQDDTDALVSVFVGLRLGEYRLLPEDIPAPFPSVCKGAHALFDCGSHPRVAFAVATPGPLPPPPRSVAQRLRRRWIDSGNKDEAIQHILDFVSALLRTTEPDESPLIGKLRAFAPWYARDLLVDLEIYEPGVPAFCRKVLRDAAFREALPSLDLRPAGEPALLSLARLLYDPTALDEEHAVAGARVLLSRWFHIEGTVPEIRDVVASRADFFRDLFFSRPDVLLHGGYFLASGPVSFTDEELAEFWIRGFRRTGYPVFHPSREVRDILLRTKIPPVIDDGPEGARLVIGILAVLVLLPDPPDVSSFFTRVVEALPQLPSLPTVALPEDERRFAHDFQYLIAHLRAAGAEIPQRAAEWHAALCAAV